MSWIRYSSQSWLYPRSPDRLWWCVRDVLNYSNDWDGRLRVCWLRRRRNHTYLLSVPPYLRELVEERIDLIEDVLEQLLGQHQIDVYPIVLDDDLSARVVLCSPLSAIDLL